MSCPWTRTYTHQMARLDIRELQSGRAGREGLLEPATIIYAYRLNTGHSPSISVHADHVEIGCSVEPAGSPVIRFINVEISFTKCRLGGSRAWWLCPNCSRRVAVLFGWGRFECRECAKLSYQCQSESESDRALRRAEKLRKRLGWAPGVANPREGRPLGMHGAMYNKLLREYAKAEADVWGQLGGWLLQRRP
jgi:hypothetical protein